MESEYPNIDQCNPKECISAKMMICNRLVANIFRKYLKQYNITDSQLSILFFITKKKSVTQKEVSEFLYLEKSTVNRNIKRLMDSDLIIITKKEYNTTRKGKVLLESLIPDWKRAMHEVQELIGTSGLNSLSILHDKLVAKND